MLLSFFFFWIEGSICVAEDDSESEEVCASTDLDELCVSDINRFS